jgi:hypothetical protein
MSESETPIIARFSFKPERAGEFLEGTQTITQLEIDSIDEVMDYVVQFDDALIDACAIVNGQVVSLSDFPSEVE